MLEGAYIDLADLMTLKVKARQKIPSVSPASGKSGGIQISKLKGRGIDFSEVRLYESGDDIRTIDWKVTARMNKPHTKIFREEREQQTRIIIDQRQNMFFGSQKRLKSVAAAEVAAGIAWITNQRNNQLGGIIIGNNSFADHKPSQKQNSLIKFLADVASFNQALESKYPLPSPENIYNSLETLYFSKPSNNRIIFVSDFQNSLAVWQEVFKKLARKNELIALHIFDPLEQELPDSGYYAVTNGTKRYEFDADQPHTKRQYKKKFLDATEELKQKCAQLGVLYRPLSTANHWDHVSWNK